VGQNGAGKSTLLKILTGVLLPDKGTISIDGKITGLLELGTGFNMEMTGIENISMNGTLLGMNREEIDKKNTAIINFTELGDFIYEQLKTYSSGMVMRLAFAIAIHADPRCFVVDEALSVGDAYFQQKCVNRIKEFRKSGGSIIFVSHDMNSIKMLCDKAILLDHGAVVEEGSPETIVNRYNYLISKLNDRENRMTVAAKEEDHSYGTFEARIKQVAICGENSRSNVMSSGENAAITVEIEPSRDFDDLTVGILIRDKFGQDIFGTNTYHHAIAVDLKGGRMLTCAFKMRMDIGPGKYTVTAALHSHDTHLEDCFHWADNISVFEIAGNYEKQYIGICKLYPEIVVTVQK
jgi:lipopolysaccharide transport system ATP-binding protein